MSHLPYLSAVTSYSLAPRTHSGGEGSGGIQHTTTCCDMSLRLAPVFWDDQEMEAAISCQKRSQMALLLR